MAAPPSPKLEDEMKKYNAASAAVKRHNPVTSMLVILSTVNAVTLLGLITQVIRT